MPTAREVHAGERRPGENCLNQRGGGAPAKTAQAGEDARGAGAAEEASGGGTPAGASGTTAGSSCALPGGAQERLRIAASRLHPESGVVAAALGGPPGEGGMMCVSNHSVF